MEKKKQNLLKFITALCDKKFTGQIRLNFYAGSFSEKIETKETVKWGNMNTIVADGILFDEATGLIHIDSKKIDNVMLTSIREKIKSIRKEILK